MNLNPYLSFKGNCAEAFNFYAEVFGSKIGMIMTYGEAPPGEPVPPDMKDKIMHGRMTIGESVLMGSDAPVQFASTPAGFSVSINVETVEEAERIYAALSEGGSIKMPIGETFWALRFAMFIDKFGIPWMINCEKPMG
jgi:PhnB protein